MVKIGELLVHGGHLTPEGLEEALDWQVLYGGRLGTNLLEHKLVEEEQLARALGKQLGAEVAWGELQVDPAVVSAVPRILEDVDQRRPRRHHRLRILAAAAAVGGVEGAEELVLQRDQVAEGIVTTNDGHTFAPFKQKKILWDAGGAFPRSRRRAQRKTARGRVKAPVPVGWRFTSALECSRYLRRRGETACSRSRSARPFGRSSTSPPGTPPSATTVASGC